MKNRITKTRVLMMAVAIVALSIGSVLVAGRAFARIGQAAPVKQAPATNHTITVSGHGDASATPDKATLTVGVQTKGVDAEGALASNATKMASVLDALHAQGIPADHITTSDLSLYLDSQSNTYQASHSLTVALDNVSKVGAVLDAAVHAGANSSWGVSFGLKDQTPSKTSAIHAAITDARQKADAMAAALGTTVTGVGSVSETSYSSPIQYSGVARAASAPAPETQVQPGQLTVSSDVSVVYIFG